MFKLKSRTLKEKWNFPSNNGGEINGIAHSGVETFKGTPIKSLAREICQNSLDARMDNNKPVKIEFKTFNLNLKEIPGYEDLMDAINRSNDFWSKQKHSKDAEKFFKRAIKTMKQKEISCLRISDFNTSGLVGSEEEYNSPWCNLIKSSGASDKSGKNGGSFGIGKYAPYACSDIRTIFYSTNDIEGISATQGVSRLTSFKSKNGEITQGTGFYGEANNKPLKKQISLAQSYSREIRNYGTDIYVLGFNERKNWEEKMVASIIDSFLYAIYEEKLVVEVEETLISKNTLSKLIISHKEYFEEYADEYYETLTNEKESKTFVEEINDDSEIEGKLTLKMMINPEFSRRVAMIRETGMKIQDKGNISGLIPFAGTLFIEGEKINSYLRGLENPQHLKWEIERAENQTKAKEVLKRLLHFMKKSLNEMQDDKKEEYMDLDVGELLSVTESEDSKSQEKVESITENINNIKFVQVKPKVKSDNEPKEIIINPPLPKDPTPDDPNPNPESPRNPNPGNPNPNPGNPDPNKEKTKKLHLIDIKNLRVFTKNKSDGEYTIIFTPQKASKYAVLDVFMAAETKNYKAEVVSATVENFTNLETKENRITNLIFSKNKPIKIDIKLDYNDYCSLEVKAYGSK